MALPTAVTYGTVTALMTKAVVDAGDAGVLPDSLPLVGQVTFTPTLADSGRVLWPGSTPPAMVFMQPVPVAFDATGALSVSLVSTDNTLGNPHDWQWTASFQVSDLNITPFSFYLPAGTTVDLALAAPVISSTGIPTVIGPVGPTGPTGPASVVPGPANTLAIGTVTSGTAAATITGTAPSQTLNLTLQAGPTGPTGPTGPAGPTPATRLISTGTGLTGGGDLSADRTLTVAYGTTSTTSVVGNDARVTGAATAASVTAEAATARAAEVIQVAFGTGGVVAVKVGGPRWYNDSGRTLTIFSVRAFVGTAPTGATLICDFNKNGTTIFTTQGNRPTIAISGFTALSGAAPDVTSVAAGDYLTADVDQVGSTIAGSDLTVQAFMR